MKHKDEQSYKTLLITLAIIGLFVVCIVLSKTPQIASNLSQQDKVMAGAQEPTDNVSTTINPNATDEDFPPEEDTTPTPKTSAKATATPRITATPIPTVNQTTQPTDTPVPTFAVDIPGEVTPTTSPTPKPVVKSTTNIGIIAGAVIGTILLIIGIVWIILSRKKDETNYTMPAPTSTPSYPPFQPDTTPTQPVSSSEWNQQPAQPQQYTTPYDQYVNGDTNNQPK